MERRESLMMKQGEVFLELVDRLIAEKEKNIRLRKKIQDLKKILKANSSK